MSRISKLTKEQVTGEAAALYERVGQQRGNVPNMFRIFAHRPENLTSMVAHLAAVTNSGSVAVRTKELVATLVSRMNRCEY